MNHAVILPLLLPLLAGALFILLPGSATRLRRAFSVSTTAALAVAAFFLHSQVADGAVIVYELGDWPAPFGIVLVADRLAATLVLLTAVLALCVISYAVRGSDRSGRHFHNLFQFQLFGLNGAFLTGDLFNLFVFFEVLLIASYGLLLHGGGRERARAGLHYVTLNLVGSTLFLFAVGVLYGVLGTLNMADLAQRIGSLPQQDIGLVRAAALLLVVVFGLKAALAPLQLWLPKTYSSASAPVAALFAIMTKVGAYAILRVFSLVFVPAGGSLASLAEFWLVILGMLTVGLGSIGVLTSTRLAQMTAHLVIASSGTLLIAFGMGNVKALAAGLFYLVHSTFAAAALFLLADLLARARGVRADRFCPGPALESHVVGALFLLLALAIAGVPPLSGFVGKLLVLRSSLGTEWAPSVLAVVLVASLLVIISLARSGSRLFFQYEAGVGVAMTLPTSDLLPVVALVVLGLGLVLFAGPTHEFLFATAEQLLQPVTYVEAVLGDLPDRLAR